MTPRGRRPAGSDTREQIEAAARAEFSRSGYRGATLRGIAREAGVDTRLVTHYFGSKAQLFASVVELPTDPETLIATIEAMPRERIGEAVARVAVEIITGVQSGETMSSLLRAAASEQDAADQVRTLLFERFLLPLSRLAGGSDPELRAALCGSQIGGLMFGRNILGLPPIVEAENETLIAALGPVLQRYLTGDLGADGTAPDDN